VVLGIMDSILMAICRIGDPDHITYPETFLKGFFIYCGDCYRQPRIKHENPRQGFGLTECFLAIVVIIVVSHLHICNTILHSAVMRLVR